MEAIRHGGGGGSDGRGWQRECLEGAPISCSSGGGVGDGRRRQTVTERSGEARHSGCSGEDNEVGAVAVDEEESQDHVNESAGIERDRNTRGGGSGWLTGIGIRR